MERKIRYSWKAKEFKKVRVINVEIFPLFDVSLKYFLYSAKISFILYLDFRKKIEISEKKLLWSHKASYSIKKSYLKKNLKHDFK